MVKPQAPETEAKLTGTISLPREAIGFLQQGKLIDAIKVTRRQTGLDLKTSKQQVEHYLLQHPELKMQLAQHQVQSGGHGLTIGLLVVFLAGFVLVVWLF